MRFLAQTPHDSLIMVVLSMFFFCDDSQKKNRIDEDL